MNTTPKCLYCGTTMKPDRTFMSMLPAGERPHFWYLCGERGSRSPAMRAQEAALSAAMQRYVEPNRVLSPEDLQSMGDEPVFIQQGDGDEYWSVVEGGSLLIGECDPDFQDMTCSFDKDGHFGLHVLGWRALERRPTDEERQSVAWEESK